MSITLRRIALTALVLASACGGGDFLAPRSITATDTYSLHSFNGGALPALISTDSNSKVMLLDDSFAFRDDGTYLERGHLQTTRDGVNTVQTLESPGTYTRDGARVTLVSSSGTITGSFINDRTLTIMAGPNTLVFQR